jgi:hypothetical protein
MRPGESLVVLTDGVTDAVGAGRERYGAERLHGCLQEIRDEPPLVVLQRIIDSLESFQVGPQADDTAILVARYTGWCRREGRHRRPRPCGAAGEVPVRRRAFDSRRRARGRRLSSAANRPLGARPRAPPRSC